MMSKNLTPLRGTSGQHPSFTNSKHKMASHSTTNPLPSFSVVDASPFVNLLQYVPKDDAAPIRQALYNALIAIICILIAVASFYTFSVLAPFLVPIFWAFLTGFILHPYKHGVVLSITKVISDFKKTSDDNITDGTTCTEQFSSTIFERLLIVRIVKRLGLTVLEASTFITHYSYTQIGYISGLAFLYLLFTQVLHPFHVSMLRFAYSTCSTILYQMPNYVIINSNLNVTILSLTLVYLITHFSRVACHNPMVTSVIHVLNECILHVIWFLLASYVWSLTWPLSVAFTSVFVVPAFVGYTYHYVLLRTAAAAARRSCVVVEQRQMEEGNAVQKDNIPSKKHNKHCSPANSSTPIHIDLPRSLKYSAVMRNRLVSDLISRKSSPYVSPLAIRHRPNPRSLLNHSLLLNSNTPASCSFIKRRNMCAHRRRDFVDRLVQYYYENDHYEKRPSRAASESANESEGRKTTCTNSDTTSSSMYYISWLFWLTILIQCFAYPTLPLIILTISILIHFSHMLYMKANFDVKSAFIFAKFEYCKSHSITFCPVGVRHGLKFWLKVENWLVLDVISPYVDTLVTISLLIFIVVSSILLLAFVVFHLYIEFGHLLELSLNLAQSLMTKLPADLSEYESFLSGSLGIMIDLKSVGNQTSSSEHLLDQAHIHGRNFIKTHLLYSTPSEVNEKVLTLWDRVFQYWFDSKNGNPENFTDIGQGHGPHVPLDAVGLSLTELLSELSSTTIGSREGNGSFTMFTFFRQNLQTLSAVSHKAWDVLSNNVSLVGSVSFQILWLILAGSSEMINLTVNIIIYLTALLYLLKNSRESDVSSLGTTPDHQSPNTAPSVLYKPIAFVYSYNSQLMGNRLIISLNTVVNSVMSISLKMIAFYVTLTYLTHYLLFKMTLVVIPMLLSALLAVVPLASQYVVAIPAALELWVMKDSMFLAFTILALHAIPCWFVDVAIYSETISPTSHTLQMADTSSSSTTVDVNNKSGVHPWVTALSVIGGVYYFGSLSGAVYGPLIVCVVIVAVSAFYSDVVKHDRTTSAVTPGPGDLISGYDAGAGLDKPLTDL